MSRVNIRVHFDFGFVGPGKIDLLELVGETGSISAAGRRLGMSYRRAWQLIDALNTTFSSPVVITQSGGTKGGGAKITEFGRQLIADYRICLEKFRNSAAPELERMESAARVKEAADERGSH